MTDRGLTHLNQLSQQELDELWAEGLNQGHTISLRVASDSMSPLIVTGDHILVSSFPPDRGPHVGEIVLLRTGEGWLVHRIIGRSGSGGKVMYLQKGDAGHQAFEVPGSSIAGRVIRIEKSDRVVDLGSHRRRAVDSIQGRLFYLVHGLLRLGGDIGRGDDGAASALRVNLSKAIRLVERAIARLGARLSRIR